MGLREWIIVLAILLMVAVAFDAWRRVRHQRRYHGSWVKPSSKDGQDQSQNAPRVSRVTGKPVRTEPSFDQVSDAVHDELSGHDQVEGRMTDDAVANRPEPAPEPAASGDRSRSRRTASAAQQPERSAADVPQSSTPAGSREASPTGRRKPLDLSRKVPVLVDSLDTEQEKDTEAAAQETDESQYEFDLKPPEPGASRVDRAATERASSQHAEEDEAAEIDPDDVLMSSSNWQTEPLPDDSSSDPVFPDAAIDELAADSVPPGYRQRDHKTADARTAEHDQSSWASSRVDEEDEWGDEDIEDPVLAEEESRQLNDEEAGEQLLAEPEAVLVVTVLAHEGVTFEGANLLSILLACGMRFGRMNIFHATDDQGRLQYSAANAFNPGTFDLDNVEHFETRGVTFFLQLPCQGSPMAAFDTMVETANTLATHLDGEVYDESRSVMTAQTLSHYRERIRDHQRAQLVKRA